MSHTCPGPLSHRYRGRVRELSPTYRGHGVHHEPGPHSFCVARMWHARGIEPLRRGSGEASQAPELGFPLERVTGIEPAFSAWEADVLPLNYTRVLRRGWRL